MAGKMLPRPIARGGDPLASVLQINAAIRLTAHGILIFIVTPESKLSCSYKNKNHLLAKVAAFA